MKKFLALCFLLSLTATLQAQKVAVVVARPFVRQAICQQLIKQGDDEVVTPPSFTKEALSTFLAEERPQAIVVDGYDGKSIPDMLVIDTHTISCAVQLGVERLIHLASFALYPPKTALPLKEDTLLVKSLNSITDPYVLAKMVALQQCQQQNSYRETRYITCLYPFLFGFHNSYDEPLDHPIKHVHERLLKAQTEHMTFALISNDGKARYELLHVEDLGQAIYTLLHREVEFGIINIGRGADEDMEFIAKTLYRASGYKGKLIFDINCYDEVPRRVLDTSRLLAMSWSPKITPTQSLQEEIDICLKR